MKTVFCLLLAPVVITLFSQGRVCATEPTSGKVLILENDRTLEGEIDRLDGQYRVRRSTGFTWVPVDKVMKLCQSRLDALAYLRSRANLQDPDERLRLARWCHLQELREEALVEVKAAAELRPAHPETQRLYHYLAQVVRAPAPKPVTPRLDKMVARDETPPVSINAESLGQFAQRVQPILMNACARCHASSEHAGAFRLERSFGHNLANRRAMQLNLAAVLAQLHGRQPERSPLLVKAVSAHGPTGEAPLKGKSAAAFSILEDWVRVTLANNPHLQEAIKPPAPLLVPAAPQKPKQATAFGRDSAPGSAPVAHDGSPGTPALPSLPVQAVAPSPAAAPESEFDPVLFNRQMHPQRFAPAAPPPGARKAK